MIRKTWPLLLGLLAVWSSCIVIDNEYAVVAPGMWRAELRLDGIRTPLNKDARPPEDGRIIQFEEVAEGILPFTFEVVYESDSAFYLNIHNGEERIRVDDIRYGRDRTNGNDTIYIDFPQYESHIEAVVEANIIEGRWVVRNRSDYSIPFVAKQGQDWRFTQLRKDPIIDLTGTWATTFGTDGDDPYPAIGEFQQDGNKLTGTFRTETGDYRYLDGTIQDNKLYLSTFDGSHAFLFEGKILPDSTIIGSFRSGKHYRTTWEARRDPGATLADPDELTYLKEGVETFDFTFPDTEGEMVSLSDPQFRDKVKIVTIMGTWCPNCADETRFLTQWLDDNPDKEVAVVSLAFEKHRDRDKAMAAIRRFKERFGVEYPVLLAGYSNKSEASEALPQLNHVLSYPTMIIVDKAGEVQRIHTGFNGPATSKYAAFVEDFDKTMVALTD